MFRCENVVHREEIFTSASNVAGKKEETDDSGKQVDRMHQQPVDSYFLFQELIELRTTEEAFHEGKTLKLASNCQFNETVEDAQLLVATIASFSFFTYVFVIWVISCYQNIIFLATVNMKFFY